jgi:molybdate transport system substrate-binding protein
MSIRFNRHFFFLYIFQSKLYTLILFLSLLVSLQLRAATLTVFAAASLTDALKEIGAAYRKETGQSVTFNFGASSILARQIEEGAPADIFFSADEAKMDELEKRGLIIKGTRKPRLSNSLVIVVARDAGLKLNSPQDLASPNIQKIALGDPKAVPIGIYARQYLEKLNLWQAIQPKIIPTENVRAALAAVEAGNADASIVYETDALISKKVKIAFEVPRAQGPQIRYPIALLKESSQPQAARKFLNYLDSPGVGAVFKKYAFTPSS